MLRSHKHSNLYTGLHVCVCFFIWQSLSVKRTSASVVLCTSCRAASTRMKTSLRSQPSFNSVFFFHSGFALINSIMSLFDVKLHKALRGHAWASPSLLLAAVEEWYRQQPVEDQSTDSPADSPAALLPHNPALTQWPPSRQGIFSQWPAPLKPVTSFLTHTHTHCASCPYTSSCTMRVENKIWRSSAAWPLLLHYV